MFSSFPGGVRLKHALPSVPITTPETVPPCGRYILPLRMHIGAPSRPLVEVGTQVKRGEKIAEAQGGISACLHSPVSGTVSAIEPHLTASGSRTDCIVIDSDGLNTPDPSLRPHPECEHDPDALIALVREAGITGMGGAGFPTAAKILSARGKADTVLFNGAECEPGIVSDFCSMLDNSPQLLHGMELLLMACGAEKGVLAIEENKSEAISLLSPLLPERITLRVLPTAYPQGGEKQLIYRSLGREVPSGGLPADVGCAVFNVETVIAVAEAVESGKPLIERYCTVAGSALQRPKLVKLAIGTPVEHILRSVDPLCEPRKVIAGGVMMGSSLFDLSVPAEKGTNGIFAMAGDDTRFREQSVCIRCGRCAENCPMGLMPNYLYMFVKKNALDKLRAYHLNDCLDCGVCAYGCPARLPLNQSFRLGKAKLRADDAARRAREQAEKEAR